MIKLIKKIIENVSDDEILDFIVENKLPYDVELLSENKSNYFMLINALQKNHNKQCTNKISITSKLLDMFNQGEKLIVNKGFVLSNIIYDNPTYRVFGDVDLYSFDLKESYIKAKELDLLDSTCINEEVYNEFSINYCGVEFEVKHLDRSCAITDCLINRFNFFTLDIQETFILLIDNTYKNFFSDFGFINDCCLRDLMDLFFFIKIYDQILKKQLNNTSKLQLEKIIELKNSIEKEVIFDSATRDKKLKSTYDIPVSHIFNKSKRIDFYLKKITTYVITESHIYVLMKLIKPKL